MAMNNPAYPTDGGFQPRLRHGVVETGVAMIDYMLDCGHDVKIRRELDRDILEEIKLVIEFKLYGHFLLVELYMIFMDEFLNDVDDAVRGARYGHIHFDGKNLKASASKSSSFSQRIKMPWIVTIIENGQPHEYRVALSFVDTLSIHGYMSLNQVCKNSGINMEYKDSIGPEDKERMDSVYFEPPDEDGLLNRFDRYSLGDLVMYSALESNRDLFKLIWQSLGIADYWAAGDPPRLTMGGTIRDILESLLFKLMKIQPDDKEGKKQLRDIWSYAGADYFRKQTDSTIYLAGFVMGGRCRNNRPTHPVITGVIADIDALSCYGEGLRAQVYPIGTPVVISYVNKMQNNRKMTLREFWEGYQSELVPLLWYAIVSLDSEEPLKCSQDYFASRFDIGKKKKKFWYEENDDGKGEVKVLTNQILNAVVGHDAMQWILFVCDEMQRDELLDRLIVEVAVMYPEAERCETVDEFWNRHEKHIGESRCELDIATGATRTLHIDEQCHAWYGVTMGELVINNLLEQRLSYKKGEPENELRKLLVNGMQGVISSQYMTVSNLVVANNITASARSLMWYLEKSCHGFQTVTDGCAIDLNQVVYPKEEEKQC